MVTGTWMAYATPNVAKHQAHFGGSVYNWHFLGHFKAYPGFIALCINVAVVLVLTLVFMLLRVPKGADATTPDDFEEEAALPLPEPVGISAVVGDPGKVRPAAGRS